MSTAEANAQWAARCGCLRRAGVGHAFLSPGSRNTPLLLAFRNAGVPSTIVVDERSSGFVALGWIRSSGLAAALISTSGSAPFHYGPAVAEADASSLPLVVLSADRPERLRAAVQCRRACKRTCCPNSSGRASIYLHRSMEQKPLM